MLAINPLIEGKIYQLTGKRSDPLYANHSYLLIDGKQAILFGLPNAHEYDVLIRQIESLVSIVHIDYLVIMQPDIPSTHVLSHLLDKGFKGKIITHRKHKPHLDAYNHGLTYYFVSENQSRLMLKSKRVIRFIETPFIHYPGSFIAYDSKSKTLFSSILFSQYGYQNNDKFIDNLEMFHEHMIPTSDFIKPILTLLKKLDIRIIAPDFGDIIDESRLTDVFKTLTKLDFYNSSYIVKSVKSSRRSYNYIPLCNQVIRRLEIFAGKNTLIEIFKESKIQLNETTLDIKETSIEGPKLWQYLFDLIYSKTSYEYLIQLESFVNKVQKTYNIKKPIIYRSALKDLDMKLTKKAVETEKLLSEIEDLGNQISKTTDQLLRCPITGFYNERFLNNFLRNEIDEEKISVLHDAGLIFISIDQLFEINKKYGQKSGNTVLKSAGYLIEQHLTEQALLFKYTGAQFIIYIKDTNQKMMEAFVSTIQNEIAQSEIFIDKITLSSGLTLYSEINHIDDIDKAIDTWFSLGNQRIHLAKRLGQNQMITYKSKQDHIIEGYALLIDEDVINQTIIERLFRRANYDVLIATDVTHALELLDQFSVNLILSEINLSKLDGFLLKQKLNENKLYQNIPFIIISHNKTNETVKRALELNVDYILEKPFYPDELMGLVRKLRGRLND